ncbi:putative RNA-directed DNA polymerase from transposon BS [Rhizoctonia solani]|uniref:Putative RNA-directed DNA polymerase from transposon BS n=1 Tax=Rhizoctonia solani TaxID=456999 RepID=A0A0K6FN90_9AGAM|nr:putative RNA-directed DNA polymerase from transposon BS [Rhizoctonia solani]
MAKPGTTRSKTAAARVVSSSKEPALPTSRAGSAAPEPLPTPGDSPSFVKPLTATAAKAFLFGQHYIESKTVTVTASLCSNLLAAIAAHPEATEFISALVCSVQLILPSAFELVCETNTQLIAIAEKVDTLLASTDKEPPAPSPPALVELGEKLDRVTQDIQKATETWQTVPPRARARTPPPSGPQPAPTSSAPVGPTRAELSRNRRLLSQGCFILVEPSPARSLDKLSPRALVQKAEFAWNAAWDMIKDTDAARKLNLTEKPRMAFKAAIRLAKGGVRYELGDRTQAALLSDARIAAEFEKGFGGASCRGQGATILLQCAPVDYDPEDPAAIVRFEEENLLQRGDVLSMTWCKPVHKRKPDQTVAVLRLEMRLHDLADRLITEGGQLQYTPVLFRKASQEPMRCLRCQKYGHKAVKCPSGADDVLNKNGLLPGVLASTHARSRNSRRLHKLHIKISIGLADQRAMWSSWSSWSLREFWERAWVLASAPGSKPFLLNKDKKWDCPSFKAEREKFNARRPENKSLLFGGPRAYDPRHRPLNLPPRPLSEMWPEGGYTTLALAQNQSYINAYRPPRWQSRERHRKETGRGEDWDGPDVRTAPRVFTSATGPNAVPIGTPCTRTPLNPTNVTARSPSPLRQPSRTCSRPRPTLPRALLLNATIMAIQEPYLDHLNSSRVPPGWTPIYPSLHRKKDQPRSRSFLAVNPRLSSNGWEQVPCSSPDVTALKVQTPSGPILICNVYNPCDANTSLPHVTTLLRSHRGHVIMLGDFNRHHPDWDESCNTQLFTSAALDLAQPLLDIINEYGLEMALPRDTPTLHSTSSKNYTRPDNVFVSATLAKTLIACDVAATSRPPCTDHFPIVTTLDTDPAEAPRIVKPNFKKTDWPRFRQVLKEGLEALPGLRRVRSQEELDRRVDDLMEVIYEAVRVSTPDLKLCVWSKRWWSSELSAHRKATRSLAARSFRARYDKENPVHEDYRVHRNRYSQAIKETKRKHWELFLEELDEETMWKAAGYLSSEPTDGGRTRIPNLSYTELDGSQTTATDNDTKSRVLMDSFFPPAPPPLPANSATPAHPKPIPDLPELQTKHIRQAVLAMKPHKAPGPDGLPACVYIQTIDLLEDHLLPIFRASLRLGIYPSEWRKSRTVVLRKPGKPDYGIAKAYHPIALLNVISKILSACVANRLNSLAEEHGWLPNHHFGGRPGRTTTDALHLLVKTVKDAWATKKVASALFLDVKGAFPHANPARLAENMRELGVPTVYVNWMLAKLNGRTTSLAFDDYTSAPLPIDNGIDQGCPLSVVFYLLYNAPLVKIPHPASNELCIAYIDDVTFVAVGATFEENHRTLVDMMTRRGGALEWSDTHNSTFELDKTACIDFAPPSSSKKRERPPLQIRDQVITPVKSHTLLGVIMDQTLTWREQCDKALAKGQKWAGQLNRLARMSYGASATTARRLYSSIAIPRFTYAADVWYTPVTAGPGKRKTGSAGFASRLARIQSSAARAILGAMRSTPVASLDAHLDLLPMHILLNEACQRAAIRLAATPPGHPLHKAVFTDVKPTDFEQWPLGRRPLPSVQPEHYPDRLTAAAHAWSDQAHLLVFADAAVSRAGVAVGAVLWETGGREVKTGFRLGEPGSHTSLDAELAGILLAAHLVSTVQENTIVEDVTIYTDSQAAISCINGHTQGASNELLKATRRAIEKAKKGSGGTDVRLTWCPGHAGVPGNEVADDLAARTASGYTHPPHLIPRFLANYRPATNPSTRKLTMKSENRKLAEAHWAATEAGAKFESRFPGISPRHFLSHSRALSRSQATLLFRLTTGHVQLRQHLHRLRLVDSPGCDHCSREHESVSHFLLRCPRYASERQAHLASHGPDFLRLGFLLHAPDALTPLCDYIKATGRFSDLVR